TLMKIIPLLYPNTHFELNKELNDIDEREDRDDIGNIYGNISIVYRDRGLGFIVRFRKLNCFLDPENSWTEMYIF
uniref:Fam20C domain-containing protein n=1 Tax=Meloidogyne hapla TaxID=6305 RepID=A0A1I8B5X3_MELHA